ncbi:hypothetical protein [Streptomyces kebangsaanensis]|uniref:hypothetical protein n=1 Tax=Streptomyces kebangsaanensis TaxID=864058 RepID=UPI000939E850|nr:hypothetical protein [Streptomyces kebangsaanensis]
MAEHFSADDLRALADALDRLTDATQSTGVVFRGYNDGEIQLRDHVIRAPWRAAEDTATQDTARARGQYVIEFPDPI